MIYALKEQIAGQSHARINYIEIRPGQSIQVGTTFGSLDGEGEFLDGGGSGLALTTNRVIQGKELDAFIEAYGLQILNDVQTWLDGNGAAKSSFVAKDEVADVSPAIEEKPE